MQRFNESTMSAGARQVAERLELLDQAMGGRHDEGHDEEEEGEQEIEEPSI